MIGLDTLYELEARLSVLMTETMTVVLRMEKLEAAAELQNVIPVLRTGPFLNNGQIPGQRPMSKSCDSSDAA